MTDDDRAPHERSRARLEAIVFGRDAAVTDAERDAAAEQLALLLEEERERGERDAAALATDALAAEPPKVVPGADASEAEIATGDLSGEAGRSRRRRLLLAGIVVVAVAIAVVVLSRLPVGWPPFAPTDSMAIFDRPQTERDLQFPPDYSGPEFDIGSVRFVGSDAGRDVYVYKVSPVELSPTDEIFVCMLIAHGEDVVGGSCMSPAEFSSGIDSRSEYEGGWIEVDWDIRSAVVVTTGEHPPIPSPLAIFDEEQDDADLNALAYLPDIPPSQQNTVRFLGDSAGYSVAAYRDADDAVCLAVYEGGTTLATSEWTCVSESEFEDAGIQLSFPIAAPGISVTWGPGPGLAFGGR